ncbi:AsmA family protein [Jannaschia ovalis]|uniref:AsmA family protein n=1 Tax=Jannaschia ovalis TaxID=3038773 RepID=A0ABY8LFG5_9RHOB|nr:AsmA family protein [Jannaschia sp. GRR-S6-38]WGH79397.1 AsmA family protein [Jannaschia sp. GRR-S6-38]
MKWLFRIAGTLLLLVFLAVAALLLVPTERIARLAADRFEATTGRALAIEGEVRATLWPRLGIRAEGVRVANASWAEDAPMLEAARLEVGVPLSVLTGGELRLETIELDEARLRLEIGPDGQRNWDFGSAEAGPSHPAAARRDGGGFAIDRAVLSGAEVSFRDQRSGASHLLRALDAELTLPDAAGPLSLSASALYGGQAMELELEAPQGAALIAGALSPVTIDLRAGATELTLDGQADLDALAFEGRARAGSTDGLAPLTALGVAPPDLPRGLGGGRIALDAALTLAPEGSLHLRDMVLDLDDNRVSGALDLWPGEARPRFAATLSAPALDLTAVAGGRGGGGGGPIGAAGWGRDPIDVSGLFAADGVLSLALGPVDLGDARLDELRARVTLKNGRAVATLQPLRAYDGRVTGELVANGRGGLSARADLAVEGLALQALLRDLAGFDRLVGQAAARIDLLGAGATGQALVESLDGRVTVDIGRGEMLGLDVAGMIRNLDPAYVGEGQKTVFDGLRLGFDVTDGVATDDGFALDAPLLTASAAGSIDLGARTLSYRLLPQLRAGGPVVPVLIEGPWADPRIRLDLEYLARQRMEIEREEVEARARAEAEAARQRAEAQAREKLASELEVAPEILTDTEALQDAIRDRVEDQLRGLLLGR